MSLFPTLLVVAASFAPGSLEIRGHPGAPRAASPELRELVGTWIAHTECDVQGNGEMRLQRMLLTVRPDDGKAGGVSATVRGIQGTAAIELDADYDRERKRYILTFAAWSPAGRGYKSKPYGLALAFLDDRRLLHGEVTGRPDCAAVVAARVPSEDASPNPKGLLYKVAINRVLDPLTEAECTGYARWLTGGEMFAVYGMPGKYNPAVTDAAAMRRILGHDLERWTDEDARKIVVIHQACAKLLRKSSEPELAALGLDFERRGIAPPLRSAPSKYPDSWSDAWFALHRPLAADILKTMELIGEGLLAQAPAEAEPEAEPPARDDAGLVGEWRGWYRCEGGNEVFMRLTFAAGTGAYDVRFEFGSGLRTTYPHGVLAMSGTLDAASGRITLEPRDWIQQPRGQVPAIGLDGRLGEGGRAIEGRVTGAPHCPEFSVTRRQLARTPVNPDGLLFKHLQPGMITATAGDCRAYAEWLVAGDQIVLGGSYFFSGLRDLDATRAVLGKDLYQWGEDDGKKLQELARHCDRLLRTQMDSEVSAVLARFAEKKLVWVPGPLGVSRTGHGVSHWLKAEQLVMVNEQHQALAAGRLAAVDALAPEVGSIDSIDALAREAGKGMRGSLGYLSEQERSAYLDSLRNARVKAALATTAVAADSWSRFPRTYTGLETVEASYGSLREALKKREASAGIAALDSAFRLESTRRADALWPEVLQTTMKELRALAAADLSRFRELADDQARQTYLSRFRSPRNGDAYYQDHQSARTLYRETVDGMVKRSEPRLLEWIASLPASAGANAVLDTFSLDVFGTAAVPDRYPGLARAVAAKKRAYNPNGYLRPDIVMSLVRGQWNEVGLVGLEDVTYLATSLRAVKKSCPGTVPENSGALTGFFWDLTKESVGRIMQGRVQSRQEAQRVFFLMANTMFNQPGCRVDYFGNVVGPCVTEQDHAAVQEFFLTSVEAQSDMQTLLRSGCGRNGAGGYVQGLLAYAGSRSKRSTAPGVKDFWQFLGS